MAIPVNLSLHEVSAKSGISTWALYKAIHNNELKAFKLTDSPNSEYYVTEEDFTDFLERRKSATLTQRSRKKARKEGPGQGR